MHLAFIFSFICFLLTSIGASLVFVIKKTNNTITAFLNSFSAGVMISSSIFSLIIPSIEYCNGLNIKSWIVLPICFSIALIAFILINKFTKQDETIINIRSVAISIGLHNIPEGMCVGFAFASASVLGGINALTSAVMVAIGIGIQNAPEGSSLSFPLYANGFSKFKSFAISSLGGFIEVPSALLAFFIGLNYLSILPYMLAFSAAIMIAVASIDLMPESVSLNKYISLIGFFIGFIIMMVLDLALS